MNERKLSLKDAAECRAVLLAEADASWRSCAGELADRIPASMQTWANEKGFIRSSDGDVYWQLPEWLGYLVENAAHSDGYPGGNGDKYREGNLESYGFASFADLKAKFADLANAWKGIVSIKIDDAEEDGGIVEVNYRATELTPDWPDDDNEDVQNV